MTWHYLDEKSEPSSYSPEQAGESSGTNCSGTVPSALSRLLPTLGGSCSRDNETAHYLTASPCGTMSAHSTGDHGEGGPSASVGAFRAQISAQPEKAQALRAPSQVYGGRWRELSVRYDPASYSWKTHRCLFDEVLPWSSVTLPRAGTMLDGVCWEHIMSEHPTNETASGSWLATPTATANQLCPSMMKWPGCRAWLPTPTSHDHKSEWSTRTGQLSQAVGSSKDPNGGKLNPTWVEWLMGWPIGWTDCELSGTARFQQWQRSHGGCSAGPDACHELSQPCDQRQGTD